MYVDLTDNERRVAYVALLMHVERIKRDGFDQSAEYAQAVAAKDKMEMAR